MSAEQLKEIEDKIQALRMKKLLTAEYIEAEAKKIIAEYEKRDKELEGIVDELKGCESKDVNRYKVMVAAVKARLDLLSGQRSLWAQLRLLSRNLEKELDRLILLKMEKAE